MSQPQPCGDDDTGICPNCGSPQVEPDPRPLDEIIASMGPHNPEWVAKADAWTERAKAGMARTGQYPTIEDYRKVYRSLERDGIQWPGDEEIYRRYDGLIAR